MKFDLPRLASSAVRKQAVTAVVALTTASGIWAGVASAEPTHGSANLNDLSRQSEELAQRINAAKADFDKKLQLLAEADAKQANDLAALDAANAQLASYQGSVDKLAAATYMGRPNSGFSAVLTATSPTNLIDKLSIHKVMGREMAVQRQGFQQATVEAQALAEASAKSAEAAKVAADQAASLREQLQAQKADLQKQIDEAKAQYMLLPPEEQRAAAPSPAVVAALGLINPIPTVGMGGLIPDARALAAYIMATYPGVRSIGGVRSDPIPDHPSGHAIDIMIGSDMGLGDAINADVQSQAARFNVRYTMWRVAHHFDHVHVTVD